ncbi:MAG: hypothetical protein J5J06_15720 [Phycisphaerae bacterium]|nr:hypothetical protein [Phycisphaerae bacterium]
MVSINATLAALDEREIARRVRGRHDEARMRFALNGNTVRNFEEFCEVIGDYYNHHFSYCVTDGARLSESEATGRAKEALESQLRRRRATIMDAYNDAADGTNGGLRVVLDTIALAFIDDSIERYVRGVFDRQVAPNIWEDKVEIIRQFIRQCGANLSSSIHADQPERYAHDFSELIRSYVESLQRTSSIFRRL